MFEYCVFDSQDIIFENCLCYCETAPIDKNSFEFTIHIRSVRERIGISRNMYLRIYYSKYHEVINCNIYRIDVPTTKIKQPL